jgi:hypothetical protein
MDLARAPRRRPLTARKKGSGYENGKDPCKWYLELPTKGDAEISVIAAEGSLLFLTMCYSAFEFPANSFIYWRVSRFCVGSCDVILWRRSKEFTLEHYHTRPQEFTIANRRLPNTLFSDVRTTYQEWRLKNISICTLQFCSALWHINTR